ncbi:MAG: inlJ [Bacteroidetes bacterium]|nr:inlJ [Bacteroidota bacterium]
MLGFFVGAIAQDEFNYIDPPPNPGDPIYVQTKDSTLHAFSQENISYNGDYKKFVKRVSDSTFISCIQDPTNNKCSIYLIDKRFEVLKAIETLNYFNKIEDIAVFNDVLYIADNDVTINKAYLKHININTLFSATNLSSINIKETLLDSLTFINRIEVYDSCNFNVVVGIGKNNNYFSYFFKYHTYMQTMNIFGHSISVDRYKLDIFRAPQYEELVDLTITDNYIFTLARGSNEFKLRRYNKFNTMNRPPLYDVFSMGVGYAEKIEHVGLNNIVVGGHYALDQNNHANSLYFINGGTYNGIKSYHYEPENSYLGHLLDFEYSSFDNSLYVLREAQNHQVKVVSKVKIDDLNNLSSVPERNFAGHVVNFSPEIDDICILNKNFLVGIGVFPSAIGNKLHCFKGSTNMEDYLSTDCDYYYGSEMESLPPLNAISTATPMTLVLNKNNILLGNSVNFNSYDYSFDFECLPWVELQNAFDPDPHFFKSSTNEIISNEDVSVYPNPVIDNIIIKSLYDIEKVEIYNVIGIKVWDNFVNAKSISVNVDDFISGTYVLKVYTNAGVATKKIVVE